MLPQKVYTCVLQIASTFHSCLYESLLHEFALILLKGHKQSWKKIDRHKKPVSELKENGHYDCQQYSGMDGAYSIRVFMKFGWCIRRPQEFLWLWNCGWNIHQSRPSLRRLRGRETHTTTHRRTHTQPVFTPCVWRQEDKAPQCQPQFLWSKCIRIDGAFHQMLLWRTWFVYLMKTMSVWICVLELETVAGVGGRFSWDRGTELTNSIYIILVREDWPLFG